MFKIDLLPEPTIKNDIGNDLVQPYKYVLISYIPKKKSAVDTTQLILIIMNDVFHKPKSQHLPHDNFLLIVIQSDNYYLGKVVCPDQELRG